MEYFEMEYSLRLYCTISQSKKNFVDGPVILNKSLNVQEWRSFFISYKIYKKKKIKGYIKKSL